MDEQEFMKLISSFSIEKLKKEKNKLYDKIGQMCFNPDLSEDVRKLEILENLITEKETDQCLQKNKEQKK